MLFFHCKTMPRPWQPPALHTQVTAFVHSFDSCSVHTSTLSFVVGWDALGSSSNMIYFVFFIYFPSFRAHVASRWWAVRGEKLKHKKKLATKPRGPSRVAINANTRLPKYSCRRQGLRASVMIVLYLSKICLYILWLRIVYTWIDLPFFRAFELPSPADNDEDQIIYFV